MSVDSRDDGVSYHSDRVHAGAPPARLRARYGPSGAVYQARPGTLDHFLAERYCLFNVSRSGQLGYLDIHHLPWPLQPGDADIESNTMAVAAGITLPDTTPLVHFARSLQVLAWPHRPLE